MSWIGHATELSPQTRTAHNLAVTVGHIVAVETSFSDKRIEFHFDQVELCGLVPALLHLPFSCIHGECQTS